MDGWVIGARGAWMGERWSEGWVDVERGMEG